VGIGSLAKSLRQTVVDDVGARPTRARRRKAGSKLYYYIAVAGGRGVARVTSLLIFFPPFSNDLIPSTLLASG